MQNIELNKAWQAIANTNVSLFLTGKAGTGKTTFLRRLREQLPKRVVVCASTGIAAINAQGVTLHSMFQLPFAPYIPETTFNNNQRRFTFPKQKIRLLRSIDVLVIDEVSMVRADVLDAVDSVLRRYRHRYKPFGGVQLLLIGDLQQLAPVVRTEEWDLLKAHYETPYFFSSKALQQLNYYTIELKKVYRQSDPVFLELLNKVRENRIDTQTLAHLNSRHIPNFNPPKEEGYIRLTSHNRQADAINQRELEALAAKEHYFEAKIEGEFPEMSFPTDKVLVLKQGAQVMFVKNDREKRFYNGMIGTITGIDDGGITIVPTDADVEIKVTPDVWQNCKYVLDEETKEISEKVIGTFTQVPLRLAWAITIHKSQGLTFERAIINANQAFAAGQTYVALSRCKTFEGLVLSDPIPAHAIITDYQVRNYTQQMAEREPSENQIQEAQRNFLYATLEELYNFTSVLYAYADVVRVMEEHFSKLYPELIARFKALEPDLRSAVDTVAKKFCAQVDYLVRTEENPAESPKLQERISAATTYFLDKLLPLIKQTSDLSLPTDSKRVKERAEASIDTLREALRVKTQLLNYVQSAPFSLTAYLRRKADILLDVADKEETGATTKASKTPKKKAEKEEKITDVPQDILHPRLFNVLRAWRADKARELSLPAYIVFSQRALISMTNMQPRTIAELKKMPGVGKAVTERYGDALLELIHEYLLEEEE
ncbi:MAG: AAA family ATPase [Bacteroidaceae bacterium]|nr:AAA family ATPase [Bacteroidaceae bacterium]